MSLVDVDAWPDTDIDAWPDTDIGLHSGIVAESVIEAHLWSTCSVLIIRLTGMHVNGGYLYALSR